MRAVVLDAVRARPEVIEVAASSLKEIKTGMNALHRLAKPPVAEGGSG